jgi:hypothetical protein
MSIQTLRKRIAVVAVSALTAGVLSVMSAPVAHGAEAVGDIDFSTPSDLVNTGVCSYTNTNAYGTTVATARSGSDIRLVRTTLGAAGDNTYLAITGPAIFVTHTLSDGTSASATLTPTTITDGTAAQGDLTTLRLTGVGTVSLSYGADAATTPVDVITITSVAACANAQWYAAGSLVQMSTTAAGSATSNVDASTSTTAGTPMYIKLQPVDVYGTAITTGTLYATATNGATIAWGTAAAGFLAGSGSAASATPTANHQLRVDPAQSTTTSTTVVTITLGATAVATKTITFHGEQASIEIVKVASGRTSSNDTGYVFYRYKDTAGNVVPGSAAAFVAASAGTRITGGTSIKAPTTSSGTLLANANIADNVEYAAGQSTTNGMLMYNCGSSSGDAKFSISATSTVNANTLTQEVSGKCNGKIASYTVGTDKASYAVGEVATLTVEAKDSSGNPVSDNTQLAAGSFSVGGGAPTYTILGTAAAAAAEVFSGGKVTLKAQMTTAGSFNTVVQLEGLAVTTAYKITDGTVTNAEVLQSIVALIASINKQIQALQKLLIKRK